MKMIGELRNQDTPIFEKARLYVASGNGSLTQASETKFQDYLKIFVNRDVNRKRSNRIWSYGEARFKNRQRRYG
jgi:hypothetical protein